MSKRCLYPVIILLLWGALRNLQANEFSCMGEAETYVKEKNVGLLREIIRNRLEKKDLTAHDHCVIAELMKRTGNVKAEYHYEKAIELAPDKAGYELFYAFYLRWYRGVMHPMWHEAKRHYNRALEKITRRMEKGDVKHHHKVIYDWTQRGQIYLHETDGIMVASNPLQKATKFDVGYATMNCITDGISECQEVDGSRVMTAETMFSRSNWRMGPALFDVTNTQEKILRKKLFRETKHRLRIRSLPLATFDVYYQYKHGENAVIPNFFDPDPFAPVVVNEYAFQVTRPLALYPMADVLLRGRASYIQRQGTIEFFPEKSETITMVDGDLNWSRFLGGPNKILHENFFLYMDISPWRYEQIPLEISRRRLMYATKLDYAFYVPVSFPWGRMYTRGWHIRAGYFVDREYWGSNYGQKQDAYLGTELRGMHGWDFTIQPTLVRHKIYWTPESDPFTAAELKADSVIQENLMEADILRTYFTPLYRIIDEEVTPGMPKPLFLGFRPAFLNLVMPLRWDRELSGLQDMVKYKREHPVIKPSDKLTNVIVEDGRVKPYDNVFAGLELWSKWIHTGMRPVSFLVMGGVHYENFYKIGEDHFSWITRIYMGFHKL